jgi:hypothetical protein
MAAGRFVHCAAALGFPLRFQEATGDRRFDAARDTFQEFAVNHGDSDDSET